MSDGGVHPGLSVGDMAPDFSLPNQFGEPISLSGLRGTPVAIVFYPFAFSGICTQELGELRDGMDDFAEAGVRVLAISADTKYTLRAYAEAEDYNFELLSDFWPHGAAASAYGVFDRVRGMAGRSTFLLAANGSVADMFASPAGLGRPLGRYHRALERL
jgi:peroxiredoxin